VSRFRQEGIPEAELEAELLLRFFLRVDRTGLFLEDREVPEAELARYEELVLRRLKREPLAYIIGEKEFWSLSFEVSTGVLIPRPETELLVESVLRLVEDPASFRGRILDLGTGSGIIAVTLAMELPGAEVVAVDCSGQALEVAARNIARQQVSEKVSLIRGDWFSPLNEEKGFDFIVSNPPYVSEESRCNLQPELGFEPPQALFAGGEGMDAYRIIVSKAGSYLNCGGFILLEIGADQQQMIDNLFDQTTGLELIEIRRDYAGLPRIAVAKVVDGEPLRG
jgi:release factor glutamine methyltransferase